MKILGDVFRGFQYNASLMWPLELFTCRNVHIHFGSVLGASGSQFGSPGAPWVSILELLGRLCGSCCLLGSPAEIPDRLCSWFFGPVAHFESPSGAQERSWQPKSAQERSWQPKSAHNNSKSITRGCPEWSQERCCQFSEIVKSTMLYL